MSVVVWAVFAVAFVVVEGVTASLVAVWFAVGALAAMVCALLGASLPVQLVVFFVVSLLVLVGLRPFAKKVLKVRQVPTNADSLIGKVGVVTEEIDGVSSAGRVKIQGSNWMAVSGETQPILPGASVNVLRIEGAKLVVEPVAQQAVSPAGQGAAKL